MFDANSGASLLDFVKKQLAIFCQQRDQAQVNSQQLVGAIFALEMVIKFQAEDSVNPDMPKEEAVNENNAA